MPNIFNEFNRENAKHWMQEYKADHIDPKTGEVNYTSLAEACASNFGVDYEDGPLDDETHWIWEVATEV